MVGVSEVDPQELIKRVAESLKEIQELKPPEWAAYVKTGAHKERPPEQEDWWYIRSASILRKLYLNPGIGVERLRKIYGGRRNRGHKPERKYKASGAIIRHILQALEKSGFVKTEKGKGRFLTPKGQSLLDKHAKMVKQG
ncbi:MAG: 30S ribosomal protein S19e [Candidatus Aenigmatarchaeota archaeon]|nr:MAG: 30S ribosomal protein S19e [Candidatus Aenigmarchaeota archaeon]